MHVELSFILFVVGFAILIIGARMLVKGAISIATILKISPWIIGVVIVGIGTSIPELSISISSSLAGNNIGLGAIIGSNTFNLLMILGLVAFFSPVYIKREWYKDIFINVITVIVATAIVFLPIVGEAAFVGLSRGEGVLLSLLFLLWLVYMLNRKMVSDDGIDYQVMTIFTSFVVILAGIIGVFVGGKWVVEGAETFAVLLSIPPAIIGLTVVAIGTSLPELTVSLVALFKRQKGIAVGNIIGSSIFDFLGILGITALIKPLPVLESVQIDMFAAVFAALIVFFLIFAVGKERVLSRIKGIILIFSYIAYLLFLLMRL